MYMYIRMAILMVVSFYTSRIVLQQLGVVDYGIYGVVGSVVAIFGSLRGMFASTTQRFLNYESGKGNQVQLNRVFSTSVIIHFFVAVIFLLLSEVIGIWFLEYKANIATERAGAAFYVLQLSILTAVITIITVPYDAVIISREKMGAYAYISIIEALLKLLSAYLLVMGGADKLVLYGVLQLVVALITRSISNIYCKKKFPESRFVLCWDKQLIKSMSNIAGWNFFGNTSFAVTSNGLNMLLNAFGGPVVNAARSIAYQIYSVLNQFITNIAVVINPHSVKSYAAGDMKRVLDVFYFSSKIFFTVQLVIVVFFVFLIKPILLFWLGVIPDYSISFISLVLCYSVIRSFHAPLNTLFLASGQMRNYQIIEGVVLAMPLLATYIGFKCGAPFSFAFVSMIIFESINLALIVKLVSKIVELSIWQYCIKVVWPSLMCLCIAICFYLLNHICQPRFLMSLMCTTACICAILLVMVFIGMSKSERHYIYKLFKRKKDA